MVWTIKHVAVILDLPHNITRGPENRISIKDMHYTHTLPMFWF